MDSIIGYVSIEATLDIAVEKGYLQHRFLYGWNFDLRFYMQSVLFGLSFSQYSRT